MLSTAFIGIVTAIAVLGLAGAVHADRIAAVDNARVVDRSELAWNDGRMQVLVKRGSGLRVPMDGLWEPMQAKLIGGDGDRASVQAEQRVCDSVGAEESGVRVGYEATFSAGELTCY